MKRIWKIFKWTIAGIGAFILAVILVVVLFTGPIAKYFIEHKSEKFTGRIILIVQFDSTVAIIVNGEGSVWQEQEGARDRRGLRRPAAVRSGE